MCRKSRDPRCHAALRGALTVPFAVPLVRTAPLARRGDPGRATRGGAGGHRSLPSARHVPAGLLTVIDPFAAGFLAMPSGHAARVFVFDTAGSAAGLAGLEVAHAARRGRAAGAHRGFGARVLAVA